MTDTRLRALERAAFRGDLEAQDRLLAERLRTGQATYRLMDQTKTYALGKCALQDSASEFHPIHRVDGQWVVRPLTFKENLEARLWMYKNAGEEEKKLLFDSSWTDSCTAVVYNGGTTKFKIIPISEHLIGLEKDFNEPLLAVDYNDPAFAGAVELDSKDARYNSRLKKEEVLTHPAWLAAAQDADLLVEYADVVFYEIKKRSSKDLGMDFRVCENPEESQLRALFVYYLLNGSGAHGSHNLNIGLFAHVTPIQPSGNNSE